MKRTNSVSKVLLATLLVAGGAALVFEGACALFGVIPVLATCVLSLPFLAIWIRIADGKLAEEREKRYDNIVRHEIRRQIRKGQ